MSDFIGKSFGRYQILEQLGEGGMAIVFKAFDTRLERDVAIKIIRKGAFPADHVDHILKRFEREAKALARLSHPNIVKVHDFGEHDGYPFLVMEYLPSGTLKQKMGKPISWQEAIQLLLPIAEALDYAHSQNMIHRDVKPSNILLTNRGQPMLTDFGIAKVLDLEETIDLTGTSAAVGTPEYMAPEQATAKTADHRADIYALGVVLYEMVTGRKPYTADTPMAVLIKHATEPLPRPKQFVTNLSDNVEKILLKALAKNPVDRYQDMGEMVKAMEQVLNSNEVSDGKAAIEKPSRSSLKIPSFILPAAAFLFLCIILFAVFPVITKSNISSTPVSPGISGLRLPPFSAGENVYVYFDLDRTSSNRKFESRWFLKSRVLWVDLYIPVGHLEYTPVSGESQLFFYIKNPGIIGEYRVDIYRDEVLVGTQAFEIYPKE